MELCGKHIISQMNTSECLDIYSHEGPIAQTYPCDNSQSQKWEYDEEEHSLKTKGKCLSSLVEIDSTEVWAGKLNDGSYAVLLLNRASTSAMVEVSWKEIGFKEKKAKLRDLWEKTDLGIFNESYYIFLKSHDSQLLKIFPIKEDNENENNVTILVVMILGFIILLGIIFFVIYYMKKKRENHSSTSNIGSKLVDSRNENEETSN